MENKSYIEIHIEGKQDYDEKYLDSFIEKAQSPWAEVSDADTWLHELRGTAN